MTVRLLDAPVAAVGAFLSPSSIIALKLFCTRIFLCPIFRGSLRVVARGQRVWARLQRPACHLWRGV